MPSITLAELNESAENKYEDIVFELPGGKLARFLPVLRLSSEKRDAIKALGDWEDVDSYMDTCQKFLEICARTKADFAALKKALGNEPAKWDVAFEYAAGIGGLGEA